MAVITVSGNAQLMSALTAARAGDTISLAAGDYGTLKLDGLTQKFAKYAGEVTITSANPKNPAVFTSIDIDNVRNVTFDGVKFDAMSRSDGNNRPFTVNTSDSVTIRNSIFDGQLDVNGLGTKDGLRIAKSSNITFENKTYLTLPSNGIPRSHRP